MKTLRITATFILALAIPSLLWAKDSPTPTQGFCVNKISGRIRMQLTISGFVKPCRPNELGIDLSTLENLPMEQANTELDERPAPDVQEIVTSSTSEVPPRVIDNSGTVVGTIIGYDEDNGAVYAAMIAGNQALALPVSLNGFVQSFNGIGLPIYYASNTCASEALLSEITEGVIQVVLSNPAVYSNIVAGYIRPSAQVLGGTVFYGSEVPFDNHTGVLAELTFPNPTLEQIEQVDSCPFQDGLDGAVPGAALPIIGGAPMAADLTKYVPSFSVEQ